MSAGWAPKLQVFRHGAEQEPVVVIDDYARDPDLLIAEAAGLDYGPTPNAFPGVRAPVGPNLMGSVRDSLAKIIRDTFGVDDSLNRIEAFYSLVTTPPADLALIQRLPHFDGLGAQRIAILHHLSRAERGGTAFYRHRSTGFETMTAERLPAYNAAVNAELVRSGLPPAAYMDGDTAIYERIARYEARFNRLMIYRGHTLHGAEVPADLPLPADPRTGRFSINTFIWLET